MNIQIRGPHTAVVYNRLGNGRLHKIMGDGSVLAEHHVGRTSRPAWRKVPDRTAAAVAHALRCFNDSIN